MIQKKICLLGATGVGKTSLVRQYVQGIFDEKYLTSIGVKIDKKIVEITDASVQFLLWDIEGIDQYANFQRRYLRGASAVIIVVDQSREQSLLEGREIHTLVRDISECVTVLALNKSDLEIKLPWPVQELKNYQSAFDLCFSTSAKTGQQVEQMFGELAQLLMEEHKNGQVNR